MMDDCRMNVTLNGKLLGGVVLNIYGHMWLATVDGRIDREVKLRVNKVGKVCGGLKKVVKCKSLEVKVKKRLYERIIVLTVRYGTETWNMGATERGRLNVKELGCLRSICGVTGVDRVWNEEV